jgi:hypothetical protein
VRYILGAKPPKSRVLWYWCGGGLPRFMNPEEAVKYDSIKEVSAARRALVEEGMGTFVIENYELALKKYQRRMQQRERQVS